MLKQLKKGSLSCVGTGIILGAHLSPIVQNTIQQADVVFTASSDGIFEQWLLEIHSNVISLQQFYSEGKSRKITYQEIVEAILHEVRLEKAVVVVFYGHPGVFVNPSHKAIAIAQQEGYTAQMLPAISAEDCLYADLGIDPGKFGCQHYEASQFMFYKRNIDNSAYLILWQIAVAGDKSHSSFTPNANNLEILTDLLLTHYPPLHEVIIYESNTNILDSPKKLKLTLNELPGALLTGKSTLVIPPSKKMVKNEIVHKKLTKSNPMTLI